MKLEKLPSGSYRVQKMVKGQRYSLTFNHKPTEKEIMLAFSERIQDNEPKIKGSFSDYAYRYIDIKRDILSPASVRTYTNMIGRLSDKFQKTNLYDITQELVQKEINDYSVDHAPKTARSLHGFISSVLGMYRPQFVLKTTLPRLEKQKRYLPSYDDIKRVLDTVNGTEYVIPFKLGILGLRRGEICALELSDLKDRELAINKTVVYNKGWKIKKTPKTDEANRTILIPEQLANEIKDAGKIYDGDPKRLNKHLQRVQKQLGIPQFRFHDLRHYFASYASTLGIPEADIMAMGGWKSDYVFKSIYRDSMNESRKASMDKIGDNIF